MCGHLDPHALEIRNFQNISKILEYGIKSWIKILQTFPGLVNGKTPNF